MSNDTLPNQSDSQAATYSPLQYVVRTGVMRTLSVMSGNRRYDYGDRIVTRTDRGTEFGVVLCEATQAAIDQIDETIGGRIVRPMTPEDETVWQDQQLRTAIDAALCSRLVKELGLVMQVVDVERLLGGERIVFFFLADKRVDFRQLVRQLAAELQTRIEMRQIGVRDEAKLLADYGDCGKPVCCNTHLHKMPPVSMRMAKLQKATLDPSKISGRCGRLKCCLRYEFDTYEELQSKMPSVGSRIVTPDGAATVLGHEILAQQLLVQTEDNRRILVGMDSVLAVTRRASIRPEKSSRNNRDDIPDD